ncbi:uncharacterized protein LOC127879778 [Dreissena polymorpha]|uniref:uncharacterized protein LOC127879778 n=1 Tax=Dreissena polymorpha TaxID=45954 RepID=UPI002263E5F1|nr:uncharacterized protein LOC127879778 [Dreissena polymorpha]
MDRTSASYKMTYGLKRTFHTQTLQSIREQEFSLNIDEATSNNNKKVLSVLVSYFSKTEGRVVVEHLAALELENCKTSTIFEALCDLFELNQIPWTNLVSILMDSCAVMRGSKNGLERRIREEKAPNLLDIDGDVCHHIHNGTKKFCAPFDSWVEDLFSALCTDHKYCVDLRDSLAEVCNLLGIKFTAPERFLSHRWLSAYDLAVSTLRMWSAYQVFYYAFIDKAFKADYWPVVKAILVACKVSQPAKEQIKAIIAEVGAKKMTADGQKRKKEIVEKVMFQERKTLLILYFYASVLPLMKRYVVLFQSKEPLVHRLNDEQVDVFREFLSCFVKQEHIVNKNGKQLKNMDLSEDTGLYLSADDMFVGSKAKQIMKGETKKDSVSENFKKLAITSYMATGVYLQQKLPLDNPVLRRLSALDPLAHGHSATLKALKQLPSLLPNRLNQEETDSYEDEVHRFQVDQHLPDPEQRLDEWWGNVFVAGKYPALSKVALLACTVFHGPMVESSFNTMGDIIGVKSASVTVETYASIQTVKYFLKARNTTALSYFDRVDVLYSPVNHILAVNMKTASASYRGSLKAKREETDENNRLLDRKTPKPLSKVQTLLNMRSQAQQEWQSHEDQQRKQAQKRLLKDLAFKKRIQ